MSEAPAGTHNASRYNNHGCRCETCTDAHAADIAAQRAARKLRAAADPALVPHGAGGYENWGCRCEACKTGHEARRRRG